ncbi:MAG TPA: DUF4011 domain-containing protein, partial [Xanthomonadaceae bacterium]|nr:DUF4011 domain-containing protein [Xanthomonadaceae bacterium]
MSDDAVQPTFRQLIASQQGQFLPVDDVLFLMLPLLRTVAQLHGLGLVASLSADMVVQNDDRTLHLRAPEGREPKLDVAAVDAIQPRPGSGLNIVGEVRQTSDAARGTSIGRVDVQRDAIQAVTRPIYLPGFQSWEIACGHHDEITDIFQFGQMLACLALGLNFDDVDDLESFAAHRGNLFAINARLHPVIAKILVETTALNRHERTSDLVNLIHRLETWRDQPVGVDMQRVFAETQAGSSRRLAVLSHLRDRLFDLSRRNRLLHFRPTASSVNMTVASVPLVMQIASIRPGQLCTWGGEFAKDVIGGEPVGLQKWLRFEDQPYLPTALDRIIQEAHRDRAEFGFSSARLVIAFLRWNNLKEAPDERIVSPLLWLPVEITKKKGVRDQYVLQCEHTEAEFNPALRHYLRQLCDIQLPDRIDLEDVSLDAIHADLAAQIQRSEPGVDLRLQTRPSIELIHQKAVQRLQQFNRRRGRERLRHTSPAVRPDFSYDRNDYRPLGLALFRQRVQPSPLPLRGAVGAAPLPRQPLMAATSDEVEHLTFALQQDSGHRYAWDLDLTQVTLANFHYKKMSLVRDYAQLIEEGTSNIAFDRVFSIEPKQIETDPPQAIPLSEQWNVVASDATQDTAVSLSRTGRSFIIQGPPGTGKSQTITNLIADFAARGKRVLFVCEKRAALDVVYHRLKQSGLDDLCCLIHDSQDDKKAFIADLRECYARWTSRADELSRISALRNASLAALSKDLERIEQFEQAMRHMPDTLACTVRNLIRRLIALPRPDASVGAAERERLPDYAVWERNRDLTTQLVEALRERFGLESLARHPFSRLSAQALASDQVYADVMARVGECE